MSAKRNQKGRVVRYRSVNEKENLRLLLQKDKIVHRFDAAHRTRMYSTAGNDHFSTTSGFPCQELKVDGCGSGGERMWMN